MAWQLASKNVKWIAKLRLQRDEMRLIFTL